MSKELDDFEKKLEADKQMDQRKKEVQEKSLILQEHRVDRDLTKLLQNKDELEKGEKVDFSQLSPEYVEELINNSNEYIEAAKKSMCFMNEDFRMVVPFFKKNLILIGADTGDGKSTTVANVIYSTVTSINPATGKLGRVLVLSNEEAPEDFYNRITAVHLGLKYTNHNLITDEEKDQYSKFIPLWCKDSRLSIIGDTYQGISGWTTTLEGIEKIFNNLLESGNPPDVVILDYYQNVKRSKNDPELDQYKTQAMFAAFLDKMKLVYPGPIVVMAQMKRLTNDEDTTPFNVRLKGSKEICDKATFIAEITPERALLRSKWKVWKSRFNDSAGESFYVGYDRGKFVPYSEEFQASVAKIVQKNLEAKYKSDLGLNKKDDKDEE